MIHLEVAVAAPISEPLTYTCPAGETHRLRPGIRLLVPLGRRRVTGYLLAIHPPAPTPYTLKPVSELLDTEPLFPENMIPFFRWIAAYYRHPIGEVIQNGLPGGLTAQSGQTVSLTEAGRTFLEDFAAREPGKCPPWLPRLLEKGVLTPAATRVARREPGGNRLLNQWQKSGYIDIKETLVASRIREKTEICVRQQSADQSGYDLKTSEEKTLHLIREIMAEKGDSPIPRRDLTMAYGGAGRALKSLSEKGLVAMEEHQVYRDPFGEKPPVFPKPAELTPEQRAVLAELLPAIDQKRFICFLLHGVTGSGKTEVYLRAAEKALARGRSVLVLVPEIALASQIEAHFFSRFGRRVALLHSGLSAGERFDQWQQIIRGEAEIVIGARSAIFAPLVEPGLIIVDEEHDGAYKQEDTLRYQARDLAVLRARMQNCPVLLGSATPSLVSYHNTTTGKYRLLSMTRRIEDRPLPEVTIIDLGQCPRQKGESVTLFSPELLTAMEKNIEAGNQNLIFLNRRGYANLMLCQDCGMPVKCRHCDISLTLHRGKGLLTCHYCGYQVKSAIICPSCSSPRVKAIGFGTERLEAELKERFPQARIARLDRDTGANRRSFLKILKAVHRREIDILVGTQMITKGHHFPHVTLVGVIWADAGLGLPDYKAGERTFQLISQVTGRAGRGEKPGRVIIQTHQPGHYTLVGARNHDYHAFYEEELSRRGSLQFPPFSRLVNLRFSGADEEAVKKGATLTASRIREIALARQVIVLGPAAAPLARLRGKYRWQLLLKGADSTALHDVCDRLADQVQAPLRSLKVSLSVDVDPENML